MSVRSGMDDLRSGLQRQTRIERSGIRRVFTPHTPISSVDLFFGRQDEVQRIIDSILTPGLHAVLFGERGVGKSSLAIVSSDLILRDLVHGAFVSIRCDSQTTFASIAAAILKTLNVRIGAPARDETRSFGSKISVGLPGLGGGADGGRSETIKHGADAPAVTPGTLADAVQGREGVVLIDEFDAVQRKSDRRSIAELIKQLSDAGSSLKILVVGIGDSCADLMAGHPSVGRCIKEVQLRRMSASEIRQIIVENEPRAKVSFDPPVVDEIVHLSSGYPHFTHLIALKASEKVIVESRRRVSVKDLPAALNASVQDAEETLRRTYSAAIRSSGTHMYVDIIHAAADMDSVEFSASELREAIGARIGKTITQPQLNNYLQRIVGNDGSKILRREAKGFYRFSDPRMKSYVRLVGRVKADQEAADIESPGS